MPSPDTTISFSPRPWSPAELAAQRQKMADPALTAKPSCKACHYWIAGAPRGLLAMEAEAFLGAPFGECRVSPPSFTRAYSDLLGRFPLMPEDGWCGAWWDGKGEAA